MDWGYVAGFLDADGTIRVVSQRHGCGIVFYNTNKEVLEEIRSFIGKEIGTRKGSIRELRRKYGSPIMTESGLRKIRRGKPSYRLEYFTRRDVFLILKKCFPKLIVKWQTAYDALKYLEQWKYGGTFWKTKVSIPKQALVECMKKGMTTRAMAKKFDVHPATIVRRKKKYGLPTTKHIIDKLS